MSMTIESPNLVFNPLDYIDFRVNPHVMDEERMAIDTNGKLAMVKEPDVIGRLYTWPEFAGDQLALIAVSARQQSLGRNALYVIRDVDGLWGIGKVNPSTMVATFTYHQGRKRVFNMYQREAAYVFRMSPERSIPSWTLPDRVNEHRKVAAHWMQRTELLPLQLYRAAWLNNEDDNDALLELIEDEQSIMFGVKASTVRRVNLMPMSDSPDGQAISPVIYDIDDLSSLITRHPNHRVTRIHSEVLSYVSKGK